MEPTVHYYEDKDLSNETYEIQIQSNVSVFCKDLKGHVLSQKGHVLCQTVFIKPPESSTFGDLTRVLALEEHVEPPRQTLKGFRYKTPKLSLTAEATKVTTKLTSLRPVFPSKEKDLGIQNCPEQKDIITQGNFNCGVNQYTGMGPSTNMIFGQPIDQISQDIQEEESVFLPEIKEDFILKQPENIEIPNDLGIDLDEGELNAKDNRPLMEALLEDVEVSKILDSTSSFGSFFRGCCKKSQSISEEDENTCCCTESIIDRLDQVPDEGIICKKECKCKCKTMQEEYLKAKKKKTGVKFWAKFRQSFASGSGSKEKEATEKTLLSLSKDAEELSMYEVQHKSDGCMRSMEILAETKDTGCDGLEYLCKEVGPT